MEEGLSPSITKKLLLVTLVLIGVVLLVGEEDDPGLLTETAQTAQADEATAGQLDPRFAADRSQIDEEAEDEHYIVEEYDDAETDLEMGEPTLADPESEPASEDEFLIDDTQGFDPAPMADTEPSF